jgi:acetylornithine deacetylase/succinyl-diaminopimelate desuccinylase-like protein
MQCASERVSRGRPRRLVLCALMGEESGSHGARALLRARISSADFAIAGEPTNCRVVHTHKGAIAFKIITRGRSVHSSTPERGESAIKKMAGSRGLSARRIHGLADSRSMHMPSSARPRPMSASSAAARRRTSCRTTARSKSTAARLPGESHDEILRHLRERLSAEVKLLGVCPPLSTDPQHPFIRALGRETIGAPWFCDAAVFAQHGIPAVAFGPGDVAQAHTADEFVEMDDVFQATRVIENFLLSCCRISQPE